MSDDPEIVELLRIADGLDSEGDQLDVIEAAIRRTDVLGDVDTGFSLRRRAIDLTISSNAYDRYSVHFAWCFAQATRDPDRLPLSAVLEHYQYVISRLVNFPEFSRPQYEIMF